MAPGNGSSGGHGDANRLTRRTRRKRSSPRLLGLLGVVALVGAGLVVTKLIRRWNSDDAADLQRRLLEVQVLAESGDLAGAERGVGGILSGSPGDERALCLLGAIQQRQGRDQDAAGTFADVLRRNPFNPAALVYVAQKDLARGDADAAVDRLAAVRETRTCPSVLHDLAARAEISRGDIDAAIVAWRAAEAAPSSRPGAAFDVAEASWFLSRAAWSPTHAAAAGEAWDAAGQRADTSRDEALAVLVARGLSARARPSEAVAQLATFAKAPESTTPKTSAPSASLTNLAIEAACIRAAAFAAAGNRAGAEREFAALWTDPPSFRMVSARCWSLAWCGDVELARGLAEAARGAAPSSAADALVAELACVPERVESAGDLLALGLCGVGADNPRLGAAFVGSVERARRGTSRLARCLLRVVPLLPRISAGTADAESVRWVRRELTELAVDADLSQRVEIARAAIDLAAGRADAALDRLGTVPRGAAGAGEYHWVRGLALERLGRFREAAADIGTAIERGGADTVRIAGLVRCLAAAGDTADAAARADEALRSAPGDVWISAARAAVASAPEAAQRWRQAAAALKQAATLLGRRPSPADLDQAESLISAAEASPRERRRAVLMRCSLLVARGEFEAASERARFLVACDPDDTEAAELLRRSSAEGARRLAQTVTSRPDDVESRLRAAQAFAGAGEVGRALEILDRAPQAEPRVLGRRAAALAALGRFREAEATFRTLIAAAPDDPRARLGLMQVLASSGRDADAAEGLRVLMSPTTPLDVAVAAATALVTLPSAGVAEAAAVEQFSADRLGAGVGVDVGVDVGADVGADSRAREVLSAHVLLLRGRYDEALASARRLSNGDPGAAEPHVVAAIALGRAGDWPAARDELRAALVAAPAHPVARRLLTAADIRCGLAAYLKSDIGGAEASFERAACSGQALDVVAAMLLGGAHVRFGDAARAEACAKRLAAGAGHATVEPIFRSILETARGDTAGAAKRLAAALAVTPSHPMLLAATVRSQIASGQAKAAVEVCRTAIASGAARDGFASYLLGEAVAASGDPAAAIGAFGAALAEAPRSRTFESAWVRALIAAGRSEEARAYLAQTDATTADSSQDLLPSYARVLAASSDPDLALPVLVSELAAFDRRPDRASELGDLLFEAGDLAGAEASYERAIRGTPTTFGPYIGLMRVLWKTGRLDEATRRFEAESRDRPDDPVPPTICGLIAQSRSDVAAEERWYRRALDIAPGSVVAANNLAGLLTSDPARQTDAMVFAKQALAGAPTNPSVLDTYAWIAHLGGDSKSALAPITLAARLRPASAAIRFHEAEILAANALDDRAKRAWAEVLRIDPKFTATHTPSVRLRALVSTR
ncbi:MAG: tetratricopeptide repeat protein [Planctomycetes bacterium]|nr:tetratricopeptide repeat protein [Planctomycetota bacterium]